MLTFKTVLEKSAEQFPLQTALTKIDDTPITYATFYNRVQAVTEFLKERGIRPKDTVALLSENMPNWGIAYFAVTSMGATIVPILPDFHPSEIHHILRHARCKAVFASARHLDTIREGRYEAIHTIIRLDDFKLVDETVKKDVLTDILEWGEQELEQLKSVARQVTGAKEKGTYTVQEEDVAAIIYTSGTTGHSKGVMLTHKNILSDAVSTRSIIQLTPEDRLLSILPLAHTYECTLGLIVPLMHGSSVYYLDKTPTPRVLALALEKIKPTIMLSVPLVIEKIYKTRILPEFQKGKLIRTLYKLPFIRRRLHAMAGQKMMKFFGGSLRFFGIGGAALSPEVERFLREAHFPYAIGYGLTETAPLVAGAGPDKIRYRSTGPALTGVEVKIVNPHPKTGEGEIWVRGDNVMLGYFNDPDLTKDVLDDEGWFHTGDLGVFDSEEFLYIRGRSKNMIVGPSGENIYPEQIEALLNEFDCVEESLVYDDGGQLTARVNLNYELLDQRFQVTKMTNRQMREKMNELLEDMRQKLNERVASYARIKKIVEETEPFKKTPTHKIKRYLYLKK